jgi:mannan endo-1,4-beta-mannosidase
MLGTAIWLGSLLLGAQAAEYFVEVRDGGFKAGCENFYIAGWNQWEAVEAAAGAPSLSGASIPPGMTGPELVRNLMEAGKENGLNVMRTWVTPVNPQYALITAPGEYSEAAFQGLDYLVEEARKNDIRLILAFTSNWTPVGGIPQYLEWAGSTNQEDFYTDPQIKGWYKDFVSTVLNRENTLNGRTYSEDPTIMAWDLLNEPRCVGCKPGTVANWYSEMADYVKSIDPNHLVTTGEEGLYADGANPGNPGSEWGPWAAEEGQDFLADHASDSIDFSTAHSWPDNWQSVDEAFQKRFLQTRIDDSENVLKKPLLLEEWGKWVNISAGATEEERYKFMDIVFKEVEEAMSPPEPFGLQGSLFWQFYLEGQEAAPTEGGGAGLFGIYESDPSFELIRKNAEFIRALNSEPIPGCDISQAKVANTPPVPSCDPGFAGANCELPVNECLRGLDTCGKNAACLDTADGFSCECYYGFNGDASTGCEADTSTLDDLKSMYVSTPKATSCQEAIPVDYPENAPGFLYDPMNSFQYFVDLYGGHLGSRRNVTLEDCMIACQIEESCESFVFNEVQKKCLLGRGQCPNYLCPSEKEYCLSYNDRGGSFKIDCGYWETYYRLDSDVLRSCAAFEPEDGVDIPLIEGALAPFEAWQAENGEPARSTDPSLRPAPEA